MREASYDDAIQVGQQLNVHRDDVWAIIQGARFISLGELAMLVHRHFLPNKHRDADQRSGGGVAENNNDSLNGEECVRILGAGFAGGRDGTS